MTRDEKQGTGAQPSSPQVYSITAVTGWPGATGPAELVVTDYGATVLALRLPMRDGMRDVILGPGPDAVDAYASQDVYFGALAGRVANRIANAEFELDGKVYHLAPNNAPNSLHGGVPGFHQLTWTVVEKGPGEIVFERLSPDGEAGYPGNLKTRVTYRLSVVGRPPEAEVLEQEQEVPAQEESDQEQELLDQEEAGVPALVWTIVWEATTDKPTLCSLTQHSYFNLDGHATNHLDGHSLQVDASEFIELDETAAPTGRILPVEGTGLDLREPRLLKDCWSMDCRHLKQARGVDHNFCLHEKKTGPLRRAAVLRTADLELTCETTQPGIQVYTANYTGGQTGKPDEKGRPVVYQDHCGVCLETQGWPDAPHHEAFPSVRLDPDELYWQETRYIFRPLAD